MAVRSGSPLSISSTIQHHRKNIGHNMEDADRQFIMSRTAAPGSSMEQLIDMAHEGNVNNIPPYLPPEIPSQVFDPKLPT